MAYVDGAGPGVYTYGEKHLQGFLSTQPFLETMRRVQLFRVMHFQANLKELFGLFDVPVEVENGSLVRMV